MILYRLSRTIFARDLSGRGAELYGGRWNSKGTPMLYTAQSQALAFSELAIHLPLGIVPKDYSMVSIHIPDDASLLTYTVRDLPRDWRSNPHADATQRIGDRFVKDGKYLVLQVPSAIVPGDNNFLLNPRHPESVNVKIRRIEPFEFDSRFLYRKS